MNKWKYGLKLVQCLCKIDPLASWDNCLDCKDMGEYWLLPDGGKRVVGELQPWLDGLTKGGFRGTLVV